MNNRRSVPRRPGWDPRWLVAAVLLLAACSGSDDPAAPNGEVEIAYDPQSVSVSLITGESREFSVRVTGTSAYAVAWSLDGEPVGTGDAYTFTAGSVGGFVLRAEVAAGDAGGDRSWSVVVTPDLSTLPPEVDGVAVDHGDAPGEVVLRWLKGNPNPDGFPFDAFLVGASYSGPLTEGSWDAADFIVERTPGATILQELVMSAPAYDIRPGERVWFGVRVRDERGQLSSLDGGPSLEVSTAWTLDLLLVDGAGEPLATTLVSYDCGDCVEGVRNAVTGADGLLSLGPFRSVDEVVVTTKSADTDGMEPPEGWYDYVTPEIGVGTGPLNVVLPARFELDLVSCGVADPVDFMDYLLKMTRTARINPADPERRLMHSWAEYPLAVWITDEELAGTGAATGEAMRHAVAAWNAAAGEELMFEVADSLQADIVIRLESLPSNLQGQMRTIAGGAYRPVGSVQPESVNVLLNRTAAAPFTYGGVGAVTMHELGHALGLLDHSCGSGKGNLMDNGGLGASDVPADPALWHTVISATEMRSVDFVRNVGSGVPMTGYETE